jgi:membrane protein DedA with SNARE-associated domain
MPDQLGPLLEGIGTFFEANAAAPWALGLVLLLAAFDGLLPPLPSESIIIALAAFGASTSRPNLLVLGLVAAIGAWAGDNLTYLLARHTPLRRLRHTQRPRLRAAFDFASRALADRGGLIIVMARYIPVGRVAVNVTAGASEFLPRRFRQLTALAAVTWAAYNVALGAVAGVWIKENPLLGAAIGIGVALLLGVVLDKVIHRMAARAT